jgi:hypothetical protein
MSERLSDIFRLTSRAWFGLVQTAESRVGIDPMAQKLLNNLGFARLILALSRA